MKYTDGNLLHNKQLIEEKLIQAYEELKLYCKFHDQELISLQDFMNTVERVRLSTVHNFDESLQIVLNDLMPYRYSY
ncbi:hypothetical protein [Lysinibacillus sp. Bpr_S20]|uniref:hypothetical protein n=1 Tax=Lysinibacillus sp. Bpr_S20 TaxID=2933964 RepID=UPI002011BBA5|nr:hypothetical protein [Lysinibacillus sp. Bpr_S20]MCL1700785.1 hypothetical protein [Lysinibacillus sp. Bpr_S20]